MEAVYTHDTPYPRGRGRPDERFGLTAHRRCAVASQDG
jgi:hypothetical protein